MYVVYMNELLLLLLLSQIFKRDIYYSVWAIDRLYFQKIPI